MKIINKHTYADITEKNIETQYTFKTDPHYTTMIGYQVIFTTEYDRVIFGKAFHKKQVKEIPFLFKTLEMAKDFCEINPDFDFYNFTNGINHEVQYYTYKLTIGKNKELIGYIRWDKESVHMSDKQCHIIFDFDKYPIIYGFVKDIRLYDWNNTYSLRDVNYVGFNTMLSKLIPQKPEEPKERQWRFELVTQ